MFIVQVFTGFYYNLSLVTLCFLCSVFFYSVPLSSAAYPGWTFLTAIFIERANA